MKSRPLNISVAKSSSSRTRISISKLPIRAISRSPNLSSPNAPALPSFAASRVDSSQHRVDGDARADEVNHGGNMFGFECAAAARRRRRLQFADPQNFCVLPNPGIGIVGTDPARIGPGMDRQERSVDGGGDVHRTAIDADDETGDPDQTNQLEQRRLVG